VVEKISKKTIAMKPDHDNDPREHGASDGNNSFEQQELRPRTNAHRFNQKTCDQAKSKRDV
jgi:hypothetical protein